VLAVVVNVQFSQKNTLSLNLEPQALDPESSSGPRKSWKLYMMLDSEIGLRKQWTWEGSCSIDSEEG